MTELVINRAPRRHSWPQEGEPGVVRLHGSAVADGNDRTEKRCNLCGLVKITVHPPEGLAYRKWRHKSGAEFQCDAAPPCLETADAGEVPLS